MKQTNVGLVAGKTMDGRKTGSFAIPPDIKLLLLFLGVLVAWSCRRDTDRAPEVVKPDLKVVMPGTWAATYLNVKMPTYQSGDTSEVFEASEEYWEAKYQVKPYRTYFGGEQKFRTVFRGVRGDVFGEAKGIWNIFGDTLVMIEPNKTVQYKVLIDKGMAHFSAVLDWDQDGEEDDEFYAIFRQVSKSSAE